MRLNNRLLTVSLFGSLALAPASYSQANPVSDLSGTVQDQTGASIPGAAIILTNTDTGARRTDTSDSSGNYRFSSLPVGHYKLDIAKDGFKTYTQASIELQVNSNPTIAVGMQLGATTETVEVDASAPLVETQSVGVGQVVDQKQIVDLPLNGRDATQLITLSGAAVQGSPGGISNTLDYPNSPSYSLAGGQANGTNYFLDGAPHMDIRTNLGLPLPFPDALDQFKVETSSLGANYGSLPGGAVNAVTRSGTNTFHGTFFEFIRNGAVNAQNYFFNPATGVRDSLKRNQYGGTVGGRIIRDKLFFFAGLQVTNIRSNPFTSTFTVPNAVRNNGDFTTLLTSTANGGCASSNVTLKPGFTSKISPSSFNAVASNMLAYLPVTSDPCGKINVTTPTSSNEYMGVARVDYLQSSKNTINLRYFVSDYALKAQFVNNNILTSGTPGLKDRVTGIELGDTFILTSNLVNSVRLFYTRSAVQRIGASGVPTPTQLGQNVYSPIANYLGQFSVSGYFSTAANPGYIYTNTIGIAEDLTWNKGRHTVIAGFYMTHGSMFANGQYQMNPRNAFDGSISGNAMLDFLTGNVTTFQQGNGQTGNERINQPALYIQDNWKMTKKFQLNAGLRWDPFIPQKQKYNQTSDFSLAGLKAGTLSKTYPNAPAGLTFPGDSGFNGQSAVLPRYGDFAPRVGIVFSPRGDGREVFRAGYGLFFTGSYLWQTMHIPLNAPWGNTIVLTAPSGGLTNPWASYGVNPFPTAPVSASTVFPAAATYVFEPQNIHATSMQQYNVSYQRQFGPATSMSLAYLGNHTMHQALGQENNPAIYIPGTSTGIAGSCGFLSGANLPKSGTACSSTANTQARRTFNTISSYGTYYASTDILNDDFTANYNGMLVSMNHRLRNGLNVIANYTWSHCLNYGENSQDIGNQFQNPNNPSAEYANCTLDRRNLVNVSVVGSTPKFNGTWTRVLLSGWTGSAIYTYQSGAPVNVTRGTDNSLTAYGSDRPNVVGSATSNAPRTVKQFFNTSAFASAAVGQFGNTPRNYLNGPSLWNADVAAWKSISFRDLARLELRFEAFNVFNHARFNTPIAAMSSTSTFGQITSALDPRILQAAAKINF